MDDDTSDILGGPTLHNVRGNRSGWFSGLSIVLTVPAIFFLYLVGAQIWERFLLWREKSYKLAMRRRHGIPDNDHRPFNVAYAAVVRARQEEEVASRRAKVHQVLMEDRRVAPPNENIRHRPGTLQNVHPTRPMAVPGRFDFSTDDTFSPSSSPANPRSANLEDRRNPKPFVYAAESQYEVDTSKAGPSRRGNRKLLANDRIEKRGLDGHESDQSDQRKRTRRENQEFVDEEEVAVKPQSHRGSKRVLVDDDDNDDDPYQINKNREKRLRKVSLEETPQQGGVDMDIDEEEDEVPELRPSTRGKKRDRAEAGSTFGGDDDDSAEEAEADNFKAHRHRKRRTYLKRKSDVGTSSRGTKRDRDVAEDDSGAESDQASLKVSRKKRGKRSTQTPAVIEEDISMDDLPSGKVKVRHIGEEWETNGIKHKIGPNGQRLRQALVKKERQKFPMPRDSQHPDRQANLEVCVEVWLTEEDYREAKEQMRLAWQDSNKLLIEPETPTADTQGSPGPQTTTGKDLLWQSTIAPATGTSTPMRTTPPSTPQYKPGRDIQRRSISTNVGLRINPFQTNQTPGKRIASMARVSSAWTGASILPGSPASPVSTPGSPGGKNLSKWEKQDLEAKAMMRMREARRKKDEEKAQKLREEQEKFEKEKKEKEKKEKEVAGAPKVVPTITLTKPPEDNHAQTETKPSTFLFAGPSTASEPSKAPAANPLFPSLGGQPSGEKALSPGLNPSLFPTPPAPPTFLSGGASKPGESLFGASKPEAKLNTFTGFSASSTPASSSRPPTGPTFSFTPPSSQPVQPSKPEVKKDGQPTLGPSMSSRLGPQTNASQPVPATTFSFGKPTGETAKLSAAFSAPQAQTGPAATTAPTGPANSSSFNFGKPAAATAPSPFLSVTSGADAKPASTASPFSFKPPSESANVAASVPSLGTTAPKFSFGPSIADNAQTANKPSIPVSDAAPKSAFSGFGAAPASMNATGPATATAKPIFSFAPPSSTTATLGATNADPTKSAFGGMTSSASAALTPSVSGFTPTSNGVQKPVFGVQTNPSPFGSRNVFGNGGSSNAFGSTAEAAKTFPVSFAIPPAPTSNMADTTPPTTSPASAPNPTAFVFKTSTVPTGQSVFGSVPSSSGPSFGGGNGFGRPPSKSQK